MFLGGGEGWGGGGGVDRGTGVGGSYLRNPKPETDSFIPLCCNNLLLTWGLALLHLILGGCF